jgi:cell division protein FtsN
MKKRIFYIIHLDKERIILLSTIFIAVVLTSFTIGYKIGKDKTIQDSNLVQIESPSIPKISKPEEIKQEPKEEKPTISIEELKKAEKISSVTRIMKENTIDNSPTTSQIIENDKEIEHPKKEEWKVYKKPFSNEKKEEKYLIQVSAHKSEEDAQKLKNKLEENGIKAYYKKKNKYYVLYTTSNSSEESKEIKEKLKSLNIEKVVIKKLNN